MYGEDCGSLRYAPEPWRPMKSGATVRRRLLEEGSLANLARFRITDPSKHALVFVDDHPERLQLSDPMCLSIRATTYDARKIDDSTAQDDMRETIWAIHERR
jgi:hypothetical protein